MNGKLLLCLILVLSLVLGSCKVTDEDSRGGGSQAVPLPRAESVDDLVAAVTNGEATPVVLGWFELEKPRIEAYSFLEYPEEFGPGEAYYWGEWQTRSDNYCSVRMQKNYLPVSVDLTLGWLAGVAGAEVADLQGQFHALYEVHGGTVEELKGHEGERVGDRFTFERDGTVVELLTRDVMAEELEILAIKLTADKLAEVMAAVERYPEFKEFGTADQDATLLDLIELIDEERAVGLLNQFDYSGFKRHQIFAPAHEVEDYPYIEATFYQNGTLWWASEIMCLAGFYDDGDKTQLLFTPAWYAAHCGHTADELSAEFDGLLVEHGHHRLMHDAYHDDYDVEYTYAYIGEVNLIRRRYTSYKDGSHAIYLLQSGPQLHQGAAAGIPAWQGAELPFSEEPGPLEDFLRLLMDNSVAQLRTKHFFSFESTNFDTKLYTPQPFTTRQRLELFDYKRNSRLKCRIHTLDQTYIEDVTFTPAWFDEVSEGSALELGADFDRLLSEYGTSQESPDGAFAEWVGFGPVIISREPGTDPAGAASWYRIQFPIWP